MKIKIVFAALVGIFGMVGISSAQSGARISKIVIDNYNPATDEQIVQVKLPATHDRPIVIFEAVLPASSEGACLASTDFSAAQPVGTDRASIAYDAATNSHVIKWRVKEASREGCRVLIASDGQVDAADYLVWRSAFGNTQPLFEGETEKSDSSNARTRVTSLQVTFSTVVL